MNSKRHCSPIQQCVNQGMTKSDEELLRAAREGCHSAFAELQNIHSRRLYRQILSIIKNREDAEDALQDTFLRAYRALPSFEGRSSFSTWLTRIAINSTLMILRKRRLHPEALFDSLSGAEDEGPSLDVRDHALSPEQLYDQRQRCDAVLGAIERLEPILRNALSIRVSQGNSIQEIAAHLGVSSAAVKARLNRARKRLVQSPALCNHRAQSNVSTQREFIGDCDHREIAA